MKINIFWGGLTDTSAKKEALVQDIEFTVQEGKLFMLQCRAGKRAGAAAVKIACDMVDEGFVSIPKAVMMVEPTHLDQLLHPQIEASTDYSKDVIAKGLPASPGAAGGFQSVLLFSQSN